MNKEELFAAIGNVDRDLLERSEQRKDGRGKVQVLLPRILAAAAAVVLLTVGGLVAGRLIEPKSADKAVINEAESEMNEAVPHDAEVVDDGAQAPPFAGEVNKDAFALTGFGRLVSEHGSIVKAACGDTVITSEAELEKLYMILADLSYSDSILVQLEEDTAVFDKIRVFFEDGTELTAYAGGEMPSLSLDGSAAYPISERDLEKLLRVFGKD